MSVLKPNNSEGWTKILHCKLKYMKIKSLLCRKENFDDTPHYLTSFLVASFLENRATYPLSIVSVCLYVCVYVCGQLELNFNC